MPTDSFVREKFTRERTAAKELAKEYFERYPKNRYLTEVESWRDLQSANIEFTMKRLRRPISTSSLNGVRTLLRSDTDKIGASKSWHERRWRRAGLYKLGLEMEDYDKYFELQHWQEFRKQVIEVQKKNFGYNCCEKCGASPQKVTRETALHVHHLTYERLGEELFEDVIIICRRCHEKEHGHDAESQRKAALWRRGSPDS
jgi:ribosomal protein L40E